MVSGVIRYDRVSIFIHWVTAVLLIFMLVFGEELMEASEGNEGFEDAEGLLPGVLGPSVHVSVGAAILALTLFRIAWRLGNPAPAYPISMKVYEKVLAKAAAVSFYVLLIAIPMTGWLAFGGLLAEEPAMSAVRLFGVAPLPPAPFGLGGAKDLHEIGSNLAIIVTVLHVLAALKHQFVDRNGVLGRMLPH